jgi:hypothetical protein
MIVPKVSVNIISSSKLDLLGYTQIIENGHYNILKGSKLEAKGPLIKGLYQVRLHDFISDAYKYVFTVGTSSKGHSKRSRGVLKRQPEIKTAMDIELLHKRVGHANITNVLEGLQAGTVSGYAVTAKRINKKWTLQNGVCTQCILGKSKLPSFPRASKEKGKEPGDYLVTDIMGPFATETLLGEKYALTFTALDTSDGGVVNVFHTFRSPSVSRTGQTKLFLVT